MAQRLKVGIILLFGLGALTLAGCDVNGNAQNDSAATSAEKKKEDEKEVLPTPVEVAAVALGDINAVYSGTASLQADGEATAMAKIGGELIRLLVKEGDVVKAGQVLAQVDDARPRLEVKRSKANLDKARQEYERNVELHAKGLLPAGTFESQKFDLDALAVAYEIAQLELSYTRIRAPIDGTISERLIKAGNTIAANTPIFRITDLDPLLAYLHVPERELSKLAIGQPLQLRVDALPDKTYSGDVQMIGPVIDPATGTFKVTASLHDPSGQLKPGMFGRINIVYDTRSSVPLVPRVAIINGDEDPSVFVIENEVAMRRDVQIGYVSGPNVEVVSGLAAGDRVVVVGQNGLKQNGTVQVIEPGASVARIRPESDKKKDNK